MYRFESLDESCKSHYCRETNWRIYLYLNFRNENILRRFPVGTVLMLFSIVHCKCISSASHNESGLYKVP